MAKSNKKNSGGSGKGTGVGTGGGARPGAKDGNAKKTGNKRPVHPSVDDKDQEVYPFVETPEDFDFHQHAPLKKKDFTGDAGFFNHRAAEFDAKATLFREKATEAATMGSAKDRRMAKRLRKMQEKAAELRRVLSEAGIDVDAMLAEDDDNGGDEAKE